MPPNVFGLVGGRSMTYGSNIQVEMGRVDCDFSREIRLSVRNTSTKDPVCIKAGHRIAQISFGLTPIFMPSESVYIHQETVRLAGTTDPPPTTTTSDAVHRFEMVENFDTQLTHQMSREWNTSFVVHLEPKANPPAITGWLVRQKRGQKLRTLARYISSLWSRKSYLQVTSPGAPATQMVLSNEPEDRCLVRRSYDNAGYGSSGV